MQLQECQDNWSYMWTNMSTMAYCRSEPVDSTTMERGLEAGIELQHMRADIQDWRSRRCWNFLAQKILDMTLDNTAPILTSSPTVCQLIVNAILSFCNKK